MSSPALHSLPRASRVLPRGYPRPLRAEYRRRDQAARRDDPEAPTLGAWRSGGGEASVGCGG